MLLLNACGMGQRQTYNNASPTLPYKVEGASDSQRIQMYKRFNETGIKIVTIGQDYLISIPAMALFAEQSPRIRWESYELLNDVVCYLKQFRKVSVNVRAFSTKCGSPQRERALTLARSRGVADYLWSQQIDSRFIFTQGLGSDKPYVGLVSPDDLSPNARVEITFRNAVA